MQRDMDLVRELLLKLESLPMRPGAVVLISGNDAELAVPGHSADEIEYHLSLIREAGLVESPGSQLACGGISFRRLTWEGHNFLDSVRDPLIWRETKEGAKKAGGFSIDLLVALATGLIKKKIEEHTGVSVDL
jgi:hypothetical protein